MAVKRIIKDRIADFIYHYKKHINAGWSVHGKSRILLYHSVQKRNHDDDRMGLAVHPDVFYMQMRYLKENGFHVIGLAELVDRIIRNQLIPANSAVITFDDGYKGILTDAFPVLKEFNFPATLFVNIFFIEKKISRDFYWHDWETLDWDEVKELHDAGLSIGSHALSHRSLVVLNNQEIQYEASQSKDLIEKHIGSQVNTFSYPHGTFNRSVKNTLIRNNFICSCSSIEGLNGADVDIFALRRTEINSFDDTFKFKKKISGCYDWLRFLRVHD